MGRYVRERHVITLEEAVRKMTSFPANKLGLSDRGLLREGMIADIVIFNPTRVVDEADYIHPKQFPRGIHYVLVNGKIAIANGKNLRTLHGRVLRKATQ